MDMPPVAVDAAQLGDPPLLGVHHLDRGGHNLAVLLAEL